MPEMQRSMHSMQRRGTEGAAMGESGRDFYLSRAIKSHRRRGGAPGLLLSGVRGGGARPPPT